VVHSFETRVAVAVLPLGEDRGHPGDVQLRVERRTGGPRDAVPGPGRHEVRLVAEVLARVDVVVAGGDHVVVVSGGDVPGDLPRDLGAAGDGQRAALAEVVLHVHDDQRFRHGDTSAGRIPLP